MNPKTKTILMWVCIAPLALLFAFTSFGKLSGDPETDANFIRWGYNPTFKLVIGCLEGLGAIGLLIPRLRKWAAMGLIGIMIGAAYTHFMHDEARFIILNAAVTLLALGVIRLSK